MNRIVTVVAVLVSFFACHKAVPVASLEPSDPDGSMITAPPSAEAVAEVENALTNLVVRFEYDRDMLSTEAMMSLQRLAKVLRKHPNVPITVAGNCDERGTEEYNFLLGQRRAEAARHYLWVLGVRESQVETISYGAELPLDFEQTEAAFAINRRDDVTVKQQQGQVVSVTEPSMRGMGPTP